MWDTTVPMISLAMRAASLEDLPVCPAIALRLALLSAGRRAPLGAHRTSAGEFDRPEAALEGFSRAFSGGKLEERMLFLTDGGEPFATATAWHDHGAQGRLHWVGVDAAHQGMGLSKPLVSLALQRLREVGYRSAMLTTQTASWVAIKVYHRFGFRPLLRKGCEAEGWKIVSDKTGIDFLQYL